MRTNGGGSRPELVVDLTWKSSRRPGVRRRPSARPQISVDLKWQPAGSTRKPSYAPAQLGDSAVPKSRRKPYSRRKQGSTSVPSKSPKSTEVSEVSEVLTVLTVLSVLGQSSHTVPRAAAVSQSED